MHQAPLSYARAKQKIRHNPAFVFNKFATSYVRFLQQFLQLLFRIRFYFHSTSQQAAQVARDAHVKELLLGHFSARYDNEDHILKEAQAVFPNSVLAKEGLVVPVR